MPEQDADAARLASIRRYLEQARAEMEACRQQLREYGRHAQGCSAEFGPGYRCRCGWAEVAPTVLAGEAEVRTQTGGGQGG